MSWPSSFLTFIAIIFSLQTAYASKPALIKIFVVDSYHPQYLGSKNTNAGFCDAMLKYGYFDNKAQAEEYTKNDYIKTSRVIIKKLWMDSKRKNTKEDISSATLRITEAIRAFEPDLIFLGEDNATNYIGNQFLDSGIPMVFWGVNTTPVKYGLVESIEHPGHNVTGVYQSLYYVESLNLLKKIAPGVRTFAVLSDGTNTGRVHIKALEHLDRGGKLPLQLITTMSTNDFEEWKRQALKLQKKVDAFYVAQFSGLTDKNGQPVSAKDAITWYANHINIPETVGFKHWVELGMLCAVDDSVYNQGVETVAIAHDILDGGADPSTYPARTPERGPTVVNRKRAAALKIPLASDLNVDEYIESSSAPMPADTRILVVDSYHPQYDWSEETSRGFCSAMRRLGYFDNDDEVAAFLKNDYVKTPQVIVKKLWLDSKRKNSDQELEKISVSFYAAAKEFDPDLIFLGDDNAAKYLGTKFIDAPIPIVFWGLNSTPVKYGLVDSVDRPGHNATGIYQTSYYREGFALLKRIIPELKTFAVLADGTLTSRVHCKNLERLASQGELPARLVEIVNTGSYEQWRTKALDMQDRVDAFFVAQYSGLKDNKGNYVPAEEVTKWYLANIRIPEVTRGTYVKQGLLCAAFDSGYNQSYEAVLMANNILTKTQVPASYPAQTPPCGPLTVNTKRAEMLGIVLTDAMGIENYIQ